MDSNSSDDSGSEDMSENFIQLSSNRKSQRLGFSRGERSKRPLEDSEDSADADHKDTSSSSWQKSALGVTPAMCLTSNDPVINTESRMSFEFEDEDSEIDDQDVEDGNILDGPFDLGSSNFSWPPPGVENVIQNEERKLKEDKKKKPGIIYLSSIPIGYNVSRTTGFFSQFGRVGRVFLQPDLKERNKRKDKLARNFTEGWVEFISKRVAKEVATNLNMTQVGGKKRSKSHDTNWNIKYLPGFKWTNLSERLAYEKAVHQQRMRTEISQAKRETDYFKANVEKSKRAHINTVGDITDQALPVAKKSRKTANSLTDNPNRKRVYEFRQKETDDTIKKRKQIQGQKTSENQTDLKQILSSVSKISIPAEKSKPKKMTKEHKSKKELNIGPASPKKSKCDTPNMQRSPKACNKKIGKNQMDAVNSNYIAGGKPNTAGPLPDSQKNSNKSKTRNANGRKKEGNSNSDRTEFLKSVFL